MTKYLKLLFVPFLVSLPAGAYELGTHARLTEAAFARTVLADAQFLSDMGIDVGSLNPFGEAYYDVSGSQVKERKQNDFEKSKMPNKGVDFLTAKGWLMRGSIREDDAKGEENPQDDPFNPDLRRPLHHFYDPVLNRPLTVNGLQLIDSDVHKAPDWAVGSRDAFTQPNTPESNRRNHFTVFDAREAMYRALTGRDGQGNNVGRDAQGNPVPATEADRNKYWATTFRALGDIAHLLQDMGQPQHTRNDQHAGKFPTMLTGEESVFEKYIDARAKGDPSYNIDGTKVTPLPLTYDGYTPPTFTKYSDFWSTRNGAAGLGLADYSNRGFFSAGTNLGNNSYAYPSNDAANYVQESAAGLLPSYPLQTIKFLKGNVYDYNLNPGTANIRMTTESIWDAFLTSGKIYSLNRFNYNDMADLLIPRSVAYSAGLINYFFRGKIDFVPDPSNADAYTIKNLSSEAMTGTFTLYYDDLNGVRQPVPGATWDLTIAANGQYGFVSFTPPTSPAQRIEGEYMLVFNGDMGEEKATPGVTAGAMAAKKIKIIGTVYAGSANTSQGTRAVLWKTPTTIINLGVLPGGTASIAYGVSKKGAAVTGVSASSQGDLAFRWTEATGMQNLGTLPGGTWSQGMAISSDGTIIAGITDTETSVEAFRWTAETGMQLLGTLLGDDYSWAHAISADGNWIVGQSGNENWYSAFRWSEATGMQQLFTLPGEFWARASVVSPNGNVIAGYVYSQTISSAFIWTEATGMQLLDTPIGMYQWQPTGISNNGEIIVGTVNTGDYDRAVKWTAATGTVFITEPAPMNNSSTYGISQDGTQIIGHYNYRGIVWVSGATPITLPNLEGSYYATPFAIAQ